VGRGVKRARLVIPHKRVEDDDGVWDVDDQLAGCSAWGGKRSKYVAARKKKFKFKN